MRSERPLADWDATLARYLATRRALGRRYSGEERVLLSVRTSLVHAGRRDLDSATFDRWRRRWRHCAPNTQRDYALIVFRFCRYRRRRAPRCFLPDLATLPRRRPYPLPSPIDARQVAALLRFVAEQRVPRDRSLRRAALRLAIVLMFTAGLRRGEVARLRLDDVDARSGVLRIRTPKLASRAAEPATYQRPLSSVHAAPVSSCRSDASHVHPIRAVTTNARHVGCKGKSVIESTFEGSGGLKIATRAWKPLSAPKAVMVLIHGFNAHSGYMVWTGEQLAAGGLAVYALDLRGRGLSEGERFYVEKFSDYLSDVHLLVSQARSENPGLPVFVLGHSAGGVIASSYLLEHQNDIAGLVCESFAFDVGLPHLVQLALEGVSQIAPHLHVFALNNADFSRDPNAVRRMNDDPLIAKESQPAETASEMLKAADRLKSNMSSFKAPVLIIHGTADKATRPAGSQYFHDHAGSNDKTLRLYDGHFHDLLNDIGKEQVMADIQAWLDARVPMPLDAASGLASAR